MKEKYYYRFSIDVRETPTIIVFDGRRWIGIVKQAVEEGIEII